MEMFIHGGGTSFDLNDWLLMKAPAANKVPLVPTIAIGRLAA